MDPLLRFRPEFPILRRTTYLASHSLGAMPRGARAGLEQYLQLWSERGVRAWSEGWWDLAALTGDLIAPLIGAHAGEIAVQPNVTLAHGVIASCFDWRARRNKIVLVETEFPSTLYFYLELRRQGARVEVVPLDRLGAAIDGETALAPISLVMFRNSELIDAAAAIERAQRRGARVALDVFQAAGCIPVDLRRLGADFAVGGALKWLCGGPGVGYLYIREDLRPRLRPGLIGWMADREPFAFAARAVKRRRDAWGFLNGTPQVAALYAARAGLELVRRAGPAAIRKKSLRLTQRLIEGAQTRGWPVATPLEAERRGGTVVLAPPGAESVTEALLGRDILVDHRPGSGIRISPHFYNRDEEIDTVLEAMDEAVGAADQRTARTSRRLSRARKNFSE